MSATPLGGYGPIRRVFLSSCVLSLLRAFQKYRKTSNTRSARPQLPTDPAVEWQRR